jgi:ADP-ribose pyrophosphatase
METRIDGTTVYTGKVFRVERDRVRMDDGREVVRDIVRHPGSVAIVPRLADGSIVLVRQYRYAVGRELWEIPAGTRDKPGETIEATAQRELAEEAGYAAGRWRKLGEAYLVPGWADELMTFFVAEELTPTEAYAELDESFTVNPFDLHDLRVLRQTGELDAKTMLALSWAGIDIWADPAPRGR